MKSISQISPVILHYGKTIRTRDHLSYTISSESCNLFLFVTKGTGFHEVSGCKRILSPGTLEIIPPFMHQKIYTDSSEELEIIYIYFDLFESEAPRFYKEKSPLLSVNELYFVNKCCYKLASRHLERIQELCNQLFMLPSTASILEQLRQKHIMLELLIHFLEEDEITETPVNLPQINHVFKAIQYIEMHYSDISLCAASVSSYLGLHHDYLSRLFKEQIHTTLSGYIRKLRIARAKELLYIDHSIAAVAVKCGFSSVQSFCRTFKAIEQMTPGQYMELCAETNRLS